MWRCAEDQTAVLPAQMNERPAGQQHGRRAHDECTFMLFTHQSNRQCQEGGDTLMLNTLTNAWVSAVCVCVCVCVCVFWSQREFRCAVVTCVCVCSRVCVCCGVDSSCEVQYVCLCVCVCVCVCVFWSQ